MISSIISCVVLICLVIRTLASGSEQYSGDMDVHKDFDAILDFHNVIIDQKHFNFTKGLGFLNSLKDKSLLNYPVTISDINIPVLHQLLNLYFVSETLIRRKEIVDLLNVISSYDGINSNIPFRSDPHIILKSIFIREFNLTSNFLRSMGNANISLTTDDLYDTSLQLYSIPCQPVPLVKALLQVDSMLRYPRNHHLQGLLDPVINFLSGIKPSTTKDFSAMKQHDLITFSETFERTILSLGSQTKLPNVRLNEVTRAIDEVVSHVYNQMIAIQLSIRNKGESGTQYPIDSILSLKDMFTKTNPSTNRNLFHHLAISGASLLMTSTIETITHMLEVEASDITQTLQLGIKESLGLSLSFKDHRMLRPIDYTALRYGITSTAFEHMSKLYFIVGVIVDDSSVFTSAFPGANTLQTNNTSSSNEYTSPMKDSIMESYDTTTGSWNTDRLSESISGDTTRCDIHEDWEGKLPSSEEFLRKYVMTNTPVVFRGASKRESSIRRAFKREKFLKKYGSDVVPIATIPYAGAFGKDSKVSTIADIAEQFGSDLDLSSISIKGDSSHVIDNSPPLYAFSAAHPNWQKKLQKDVPLPSILQIPVSSSYPGFTQVTEELGTLEVQFYLGPKGSGAPVHYHGHAVNTLAYGEKKWYLFPPSQSFYSTLSALEFVTTDPAAKDAYQCTQRAGDILFVSSLWGHGTLNIKQSIGVAHEFSIEPFCME